MGITRFFLSLCVVVFHLTAAVPHIGLFAVNFFYVISGFLMTLVLQETYNFDWKRFSANRVLRLYPSYAVIALSALLLFSIFPNYTQFHPSWSGDNDIRSWMGNIFVVPWAFLSDQAVHATPAIASGFYFRVIPSTWSIAVELVCYFLVWLIGARSFRGAIALTGFGVFWHITMLALGEPSTLRYSPAPAAALPFGLGCIAYFVGGNIKIAASTSLSIVLLTFVSMFFLNWWTSINSPDIFSSIQFYLNTLLAFALALVVNRRRFSGIAAKLDRFLGDLAYPMFLGHYVCGLFAWELFLSADTAVRGWLIFWLGAPLTILASVIIVFAIDRPIEVVRKKIRDRKSLNHNDAVSAS